MLEIFLLNVGSGPVVQMTGESDVGKIRKDMPCWFDLHNPTAKEEEAVERFLGVGLPTRGEMVEIEASSRIYTENGALYLTTSLVAGADKPVAATDAVTFVISGHCLTTIRYSDPSPLRTFKQVITKAKPKEYPDGAHALVGLLDTIIDRLADILEYISLDLDRLSASIFLANLPSGAQDIPALTPAGHQLTHSTPTRKQRADHRDLDLKLTLAQLGRSGDLVSKARESLVSINRVLVFFAEECRMEGQCPQPEDTRVHLQNLSLDLHSLMDHASFVSGKISFLLDATLGLINVEQNQIIKIFSIATIIFLPPTLIASTYGMNFDHIPALHSGHGFPVALLFMLFSSVAPYLFFKHKGWI